MGAKVQGIADAMLLADGLPAIPNQEFDQSLDVGRLAFRKQ